ncbi:CGNR zinc finger domain-containing protein [Catenuloplanes japonicus]|uniref:CGNR zinc finger domain-containing protein n=1 Tax=Catenuloplanes japonicus TaxID=33876 RepID=UPI00068F890B|nr:CGNR zinc finger domain-containing protein [Catenuloplanes japonicus]
MEFVFVGGNLALDLLGTLKWRRSTPEEFLRAPADVARWAVEAGIVSAPPSLTAADLAALRALRECVYRLVAAALPGSGAAVSGVAVEPASGPVAVSSAGPVAGPDAGSTSGPESGPASGLSAASDVLPVSEVVLSDAPPVSDVDLGHDLAAVNAAAAGPRTTHALTGGDVLRTGTGPAIAAEVAVAAIALLGDVHAGRETRLRECERPACTRVFLDRSRGRTRAWCGMAECGNRVKAAEYRARKAAVRGS